MKITRRKFVELSTLTALGATLGSSAVRAASTRDSLSVNSLANQLDQLKRESFEPFINSVFQIRSETGRRISVQLVEVVDSKIPINAKRGYAGESFRLGFESSRNSTDLQGIYDFDHESLGRFSLFLAPAGGSKVHCEAIINRVC